MKQSQLLTLVTLPMMTGALNIFNGGARLGSKSIENLEPSRSSEYLKLNQLLISNVPKPKLYTKAMLELKRLEEEPLCHRIAAQLLMNTCRGMQDINEDTLKSTEAGLRSIHVESFAAALTICDLEQVNGIIPDPCFSIGSMALHRAFSEGKEALYVEPEQVGRCIEALFENDKTWATWLHRRNSGLLFCRAASLDMEKDQLFQLQKKLVRIMAGFASDLDLELRQLKESIKTHSHEADSYFEGFMDHLESLKAKVQGGLENVSDDVQSVASAMKYIKDSSVDVQHFLQTLFKTAIRDNEEMAAKSEKALMVSTSNVENRLNSMNQMAERTGLYAYELGKAMETIAMKMGALGEQNKVMGQKTEAILRALSNTTELFQIHTEQLEQAKLAASKIHDSLGNVAAVTNVITKFANNLSVHGSIGDWIIRLVGPPSAIIFGSYGLPPSLARNVLLFVSGGTGSELIVHLRHSNPLKWCLETIVPSSFTQLAQKYSTPSLEVPVDGIWEYAEFEIPPAHFKMTR